MRQWQNQRVEQQMFFFVVPTLGRENKGRDILVTVLAKAQEQVKVQRKEEKPN